MKKEKSKEYVKIRMFNWTILLLYPVIVICGLFVLFLYAFALFAPGYNFFIFEYLMGHKDSMDNMEEDLFYYETYYIQKD